MHIKSRIGETSSKTSQKPEGLLFRFRVESIYSFIFYFYGSFASIMGVANLGFCLKQNQGCVFARGLKVPNLINSSYQTKPIELNFSYKLLY